MKGQNIEKEEKSYVLQNEISHKSMEIQSQKEGKKEQRQYLKRSHSNIFKINRY